MKSLAEEITQPAVVGDIPALCADVEELKSLGEAAKEKIAQAHAQAVKVSVKSVPLLLKKLKLLQLLSAIRPIGAIQVRSSRNYSPSGRMFRSIQLELKSL